MSSNTKQASATSWASSPLLDHSDDAAGSAMSPATARGLLCWLRATNLLDGPTIPTSVLRTAIHNAGAAPSDPDEHCGMKHRTAVCALAIAITINTLFTVILFGVQESNSRWRGCPLGIYAFTVSMLVLAGVLLAAVFMYGLKKGRKAVYQGNGNIVLDTGCD